MNVSGTARITPKYIRALQTPRERKKSGLFFVEGIRIVAEAIQQAAQIEALVVAPALLVSEFAATMAAEQRQRGVPYLEVRAEVFRSLSLKEGPQGIGAVVRQRWATLAAVEADPGLCWVALDEVGNPGNLGTILRTCDAVGAGGVILLGPSTDPYDPAAVRGSMGAIFAQQLVRATFAEFALWKRRQRYRLVGTSAAAPLDYQEARYEEPTILLMGSERTGLSGEQVELCDLMVSIPMRGRSDSLNLAVATGVMLYEIFNQRRRRR